MKLSLVERVCWPAGSHKLMFDHCYSNNDFFCVFLFILQTTTHSAAPCDFPGFAVVTVAGKWFDLCSTVAIMTVIIIEVICQLVGIFMR